MTDTTLHAGPYDARRPALTAIIAGTIVALGLMVLFTLLGLAIGVVSLEAIGQGLGFGAAIYIVVTQIISLGAGGFTAARFMSPGDTSIATLSDIVAQPDSFSEELNSLLDQLLKGENAVISEEDLAEAKSTLQTRLDITENESQQLVDTVQNSFNSAVETLRQTSSELQERFVTAVDNVQSAVSSAALWLFIASLLGLGAAAGAGLYGRRE